MTTGSDFSHHHKVNGSIPMFFPATFEKGNNFWESLFASMKDTSHPRWRQLEKGKTNIPLVASSFLYELAHIDKGGKTEMAAVLPLKV